MKFDQLNLNPIILRNLAQMGYHEPRPIQAHAIEPIIASRDLIGLAKTGTGKTAAFVVPFAHHLISSKPPQLKGRPIDPATRLRALVICPTRELTQQVADEAGQIAQGSVLRVACAYGKVAISPQARAIARGVDLLVATPGRIRELLDADSLSLAYVKHVAIDEADRMLDMGFLPQVEKILERIPAQRQIVLFSATMPAEIEELAQRFLRDPIRIEADPHTTPVEHVEQHLLPVDDDDKVELLLHLLSQLNHRGVLVFCRTRRRVGWVGTALRRNNIDAGLLHGDMSQAQRNKSLQRFADRKSRVLVATDVAARGLHVPAVKVVVNYDLPLTPEEYVHRIGRAAHGGEQAGGHGEAFTFLSDDQQERVRWRTVLDKLGVEVFAESLPGFAPTKPVIKRNAAATRRSRDETSAARSSRKSQRQSDHSSQRKSQGKPQRKPQHSPNKKPGRSRQSRPIKKGEKPGKGVVRR